MEPTGARDEHPDLQGIRERARRRWLWGLVGAGVLGGLGGGVGPAVFDRHHGSGGHHSVVVIVVAAVVVVAIAIGVGVFVVRRSRGGEGMFTAPLASGLPRRRRRAVARAVRTATPSEDPVQRSVEIDSARRLVVQGRRSVWIFVLFIVLELAEAVFGGHNAAGTAFFYAAAAMFTGFLGWQRYTISRARRYLGLSQSELG